MLGLDIWSGSILINLVVAFALASLTAFMLQKPTVDRNIGLAFLSVELVLAVWSLGYLGSYLSEEFASSYWWHHLAFAAICFFGVSWLIFSLASTGRARWLACRRLAVLVAPSVLFLLGVVTNDWHRLFFTAVSFRGSGTLETSYGPLFWAHTVVTYSYLVVGVILYLRFSPAQTGWFRRLKYMFMFAVIPPVAINILVISKTITTSIDLTPLTVTLPVITCAIALYRYWIFNVVQSALAQAMEQNCDAVVVIDLQHRILDANIAFGRLVQVPRAALVGRSIHDVSVQLGGKEELLEQLSVRLSTRQDHPGERVSDDIVVRGVPRQVYELLVEPIRGPDVDLIGRMATLRDVTTAREVTHNLEEAVANLRAVHETAVAITSMHDLGGVLGVILNEVHRLTFADHASIATLDREGNLFTTRAHAHNGVELNLTPTSRLPSTLSRDILREGEARFVEDVIQAGAQRSSTMTNSTQAYAGVPLVNQNRPVGILYLAYNQPHTFAKADRLLIQTLAIHAAVAINNAQMFDEINLAASTDALTGLPNHRHLMDRLDEEIARAIRSEHPLAIMMIDIDDFKLVNDAHGHTKGDDLLRLVSKTLRDTLRSTDKIGRYGGDEFLALLPETDRDEAILVADRLLTAIRNLDFRVPRRGDCVTPDPAARSADTPRDSRVAIPIHLSIGVAVYPHDSSNRPELISLADTAMDRWMGMAT
ncbi:MAG: diguanylate cyclase, partial [Chloroflexi bacterium]|nr:diguanylate cyclase [Chloroflexota bacterium]